jgi:hypothetical protein
MSVAHRPNVYAVPRVAWQKCSFVASLTREGNHGDLGGRHLRT